MIARRLPGIRFEARAPQLTEALPRMDVAVFVGFAARGPLHWPVPVEDFADFTAVFGSALPLAWDAERGVQTTAYLAPAVREFFRNGGRRCWVVRVASAEAVANYFPLPGLACAEFDEVGALPRLRPALARARSAGSWSDELRVSTALLTQPFVVQTLSADGKEMEIEAHATVKLSPGDLLRLIFAPDKQPGFVLLFQVQTVEVRHETRGKRQLRLRARHVLRFETESPLLATTAATAQLFTRVLNAPPAGETVAAKVHRPEGNRPLAVELLAPRADLPAPGTLVNVTVADRHLCLTVQEARLSKDGTVVVSGTELWLSQAPLPSLQTLQTAERLSFELWVYEGTSEARRLSDLGFAPGQPRYWGDLPDDQHFYQASPSSLAPLASRRVELSFEKEQVEFWRSADGARFPLAGEGAAANVCYFPAGMLALPSQRLAPLGYYEEVLENGAARVKPLAALRRDGLAEFDARLFLDAGLLDAGVTNLLEQADFLRYFSAAPRPLQGLHAAFGFGDAALIEEATLIAVPDAVQRGWEPVGETEPQANLTSAPLPHPEWWTYLPCAERAPVPLAEGPERGNFLAGDLRVLVAPTLRVESAAERGSFTLWWEHSEPQAVFVLEEATDVRLEMGKASFEQPTVIYRGPGKRLTLSERGSGVRYYRVRAEAACVTSDWSLGVGVRISAATGYRVKTAQEYDAQPLLDVQRALLRMCAARGDLVAVLALPEHYREAEATAHIATLKASTGPVSLLRPLGSGEQQAFSYGALYHPWLIVRGDGQPQSLYGLPPDGAACGVLAARAIARGAWIAPANENLRSVVALAPPIAHEQRLALQTAQLNLIRQEPRGFLCLSADTLSDDEDLRPISVRRLLILLRRLALRLGAQYVFEPNSDAFRRLVERGFENMLAEMFERGAFAGATPAQAFQVNADTQLNALQQEQGRFLVELKVAPSLPLTFLTIRVIQAGDRTRVAEG